jgi:WD40 repeat protein/energy-coupling factor transporter ATP-binding protein EcfA2
MTTEKTICPYPGLRPFNEDESIFFKGREDHIEKIISLLEKNKFLMLTGASGDGKSSLVYAGLVPNARAGFFKARYNNWLVADFRPERSPLKNLAKSLAFHFKEQNEVVEKQISYGFSSLVKLYKSTPFYIDQTSEEWINADDKGKRVLKRKGGNLLILVDQFEEFFTNPENYTNGKPSVQAQAVINLLLETAKISLAEDLPIYVICTMRSDYIGQCADFRGLPEAIGFSQFFVPRLKRKEIHQVIEEPAILSGNKISNRLTETLINELVYGLDQLPVLQHALNQVWNMTDAGQEMDLLQLSKLAGLSKEVLPSADKKIFDKWFTELPEFKKTYFKQANLNNVLNSHANELYERSREHYNSKYNKNISIDEAHLIIKTTFQCLTKIDDARAVRNRMTLAEITYVIGKQEVTTDIVSGLIELFRMQGNTFLKPFITDNPLSVKLTNDDVLDITHESLIRNWDFLKKWADEENESRQVYLDFHKQLERWISNNKSKDYLLAAGPLSFFETWYKQCRPNKYWLLKYDQSEKTKEEKLALADKTIRDTIEFLSSSKKAIATKRNLIIAAVSIVIFVLSTFTVWAMMERKNAMSQQEIANQKTNEAMHSAQDAMNAKNTAMQLKEKAEQSESLAMTSKESAEEAQKEALKAKTFAELQKSKAEKQTLLAIDESKKAEEQRRIATEARDKAIAAETKAKKLTLLSVAQALALKSTIIEDDEQLQGLLAVQAYNLTLQNKENTQNPIIYEALRAAYAQLKNSNSSAIRNLGYEPRSVAGLNEGAELLATGKSGIINRFNVTDGTIIKSYSVVEQNLIIHTLLSFNGRKLICGYNNGEIALWDIPDLGKVSKVEINSGKELLVAAAFNSNSSMLVTASQNNVIKFWNISGAKPIYTDSIKANGLVKSIILSDDGKSVYFSTENGEINYAETATKRVNTLFVSKPAAPLCLAFSKEKNILAAGFSDGKVRLFNMNDSTVKAIHEHTSRVEQLVFNKSGALLATSSADKTIRVYDLQKADVKPIVLKSQQTKARSITFVNEHALAAGMTDKSVHVWELSSEKIAEALCPLIQRNLRKTEWEQYVGDGIEYQKTCN